MQSAVMSARLSKSINNHVEIEFNKIYYISDSECTIALLRKDTMALREYMGNRVAEILDSTTTDQWFHVRSKDNVADLGTRKNADVKDVSQNSIWQDGPDWLRQNEDEWPVSQDIHNISIPKEEVLKINIVGMSSSSSPSFLNLERFKWRSYNFLIRVIAIVLNMIRMKSFKLEKLTAKDLVDAERVCLKISMKLTENDLKEGKLKSLRPKVDNGVIVIESRAVEGLKSYYDSNRFPILTTRDVFAYLWMKKVHEENHSGITSTVAKSRRKYWVIKARKLAKRVKTSCYRCRIVDKLLAKQQMAPLPMNRLVPSPTFHVISLDLFGPLEIKDTVKQRCKKKAWGVIFNCTVTRAIYLDVTEDYGTDAILQVIRRFITIRGCPSEIQSDQGSQLIAAAKDIAELTSCWDWQSIQDWATNNRIKWTLAPAEGQHQNGLSESLIKSVKRTIRHKIGCQIFTFSQLQMIFFEIANIINSRPIGIITGSDPEQPKAVTPNDLILGRSTNEVPQGPFDYDKCITKRFRFLQNLTSEWWEEWYRTVLPSLVPNYKWLQRHRNVQINDVCLIRYGKDKRGSYRLGRIKEVKKGVDGLVRKVVLNYKLPNENCFRSVERPIHGIAVIVPVEEQENIHSRSRLDPKANDFHPTHTVN